MQIELRHGKQRNLSFDDRGRLCIGRGPEGRKGDAQLETQVVEPGASRVRIRWTEQWTAPQRWQKFDGNPIYGPAQSGEWDDWTNGVSIIPCENETKYRMYYCGRHGGIGFAEASVDEPTKWTEHPASPVLVPRDDNWEGNMINQPRVVKVTDEHWRMYYTGWGQRDVPGTSWALGLAESFDGGTTWTRYQDDPILERGDADSYDGAAAVVPSLLLIDGKWWMWYTAGVLNPDGHQNIHLCLAWSDDGIHFDKYEGNPVITDDFTDGAPRSVTSRCSVRHDDGVFRIWYSFAKPDYRICYAESLDGMHWERSPIQPVLDVTPSTPDCENPWDGVMVEYPEVQVVDGEWRLWFCGNGFGTVGYATGVCDTSLVVSVRSGDTAEPDDGWSDWQRVGNGEAVDVAPYVQCKVELSSTHAELSPRLNELHIEPTAG